MRTNISKVLAVDQVGKSALMQSPPSSTSNLNPYVSDVASVDAAASALAPTRPKFDMVMGEFAHDVTNMEDSRANKAADDLLSALVKALTPILQSRNTPETSSIGSGRVSMMTDVLPTAKGQILGLASSSLTSTRTHDTWDRSSSTAVASAEMQQRHFSNITPEPDAPAQPGNDASHQDTKLALSLLDSVSILVFNVAIHNVSLAARLTDAMLAALPVDKMAISSVISAVAAQNSTSLETAIPLILPAVAIAYGRQVDIPIEETVDTTAQNLTKTYETIVRRGTYIINQIVATSFLSRTPVLEEVLSQLVGIVYDLSIRSNQTMCALELEKAELPWEVLLPCASINLKSAASASATASAPNPPVSRLRESNAPSPEMAGLKMIPVASAEPNTFLGSYMKMPPYDSDINSVTEGTPLYAPMTSSQSLPATYAMESTTPCSSATSSTSSTCQTSASAQIPSPPLDVGPWQESCYQCTECLNGWFCPAQETPPQAVPCGLGWPCYHCANGYFCSSTSSRGTACTTDGSASYSFSTATMKPDIESVTSMILPRPCCEADVGVPGWTYLGCFQDDMSRILVGSKPLDYLRGPMSRSMCTSHCQASGYSFAGTENGYECWCGSSIRDDAVRLPESSCNVSCRGRDDETCGGSWTVSVFRCSEQGTRSDEEVCCTSSTPEAQSKTCLFPSRTSTRASSECGQPSTTALSSPSDAALYTPCCQSGNRDRETSPMTYRGPVAQLLAQARQRSKVE